MNTQNDQNEPQEDREQLLNQREAALCERERALTARQELERLGAPPQALEYLDCQSDQGLEKGLKLMAFMMKQRQQAAPAPRVYQPLAPDLSRLNYRDRAALYLSDPDQYQQAFGGNA